jgi:hypothetical protein
MLFAALLTILARSALYEVKQQGGNCMPVDILVPLSLFFMMGWVVWVLFSSVRRYKIAKFQAEVQSHLLQRLDSSQSLLAYVETEAGKQFVDGLGSLSPFLGLRCCCCGRYSAAQIRNTR